MSTRHRSPLRRQLTLTLFEAMLIGVVLACLENWLLPLVQLRLAAGATAVALLLWLPQLGITALSPTVGHVIDRLGGGRRAVLAVGGFQAGCLLLLSLPLQRPDAPWALPMALALAMLIGVSFAVYGPAWIGWVAGAIPSRSLPTYAGSRMRAIMGCKLVASLIFAAIARRWPPLESAAGLQAILVFAALARVASVVLLARLRLPPERPLPVGTSATPVPGFGQFLRSLPRTPFGRWNLVWASLQLGLALQLLYVGPYLLSPRGGDGPTGLGLGDGDGLLLYVLLIQASTVARLVGYGPAGRLVRRIGPDATLRTVCVALTLIPLAWWQLRDPVLLLAVELGHGLLLAVAECAVVSLAFGCHRDPAVRSRLVSYHQFLFSGALLLGIAGAGVLVPVLPVLPGSESAYQTLFALSLLWRVPVVLLAVRLLPAPRRLAWAEVRAVVGR